MQLIVEPPGFGDDEIRGSISHSNLGPIFIDFEDSRDMFFLHPPVVSAGGRSSGLKRSSSSETGAMSKILKKKYDGYSLPNW